MEYREIFEDAGHITLIMVDGFRLLFLKLYYSMPKLCSSSLLYIIISSRKYFLSENFQKAL